MRKFFKTLAIILLVSIGIISGITAIVFITPPSTKLDVAKLNKTTSAVEVYDCKNQIIKCSEIGNSSVKIEEIPKDVINAFIAVEDKNFFSHKGVDYLRIASAIFNNLKSFSYKQGASTITQQLIKNTHLTNKKTISRKIDEIKLARTLEKRFSKEEILEMYLNSIYFGENCYGIGQASKTYFSKDVSDLTLNEGATLAAVINAPSKLNPKKHKQSAIKRRNLVLSRMNQLGYIDSKTEINTKNQDITLNYKENYDTDKSFLTALENEYEELLEARPYTFKNCKIFTSFDSEIQKSLVENKPQTDTGYQAMVIDNESRLIVAYVSSCGEVKRNVASLAKPIVVYAPALNENVINQYTRINDEKTDFSGYSPSNYNDKYYGNVSARFALAKSLNVPAVKVLNSLTVKKSKEYAEKMNIKINSDGLGIALGAFGNELSMKDVLSAYSTFANFGEYKKACFISKIEDYNGNIIYKYDDKSIKVFSEGTCSVVNDMLNETVKTGTQKRLKDLPFTVHAKSGTNGNSNGNYDAYSVAYTGKHTLGVWLGNADGSLMSNEITGATYPTAAIKEIISDTYKNSEPKELGEKGIVELAVDKLTYERNGEILLADKNAPEKYVFKGKFIKDFAPNKTSTNFSEAKIYDYNLDFKDNTVKISYDLLPETTVEIYRNGKLVYSGNEHFEEKLTANGVYRYSIIPSINGLGGKVNGKEIILPQIKVNESKMDEPEKWWEK